MPTEQLPDIKLSEERETRIKSFLAEQIRHGINDRKPDEKDWIKIQEMYEKYELTEKKNYPFDGAAHIMLPIVATNVERMQARLHRTIWRPRYPISIGSRNSQFDDLILPTRNYTDWMVREELELKGITNRMFMELCKLGTMVSKTIFDTQIDIERRWNDVEEKFEPFPKEIHNGPRVIHVPLSDFFWAQHARTIEESPWLAQRIKLSWNTLKKRELAGKYKDVDRIKGSEDQLSEYDQALQAARGKSPEYRNHYDVYEVWFEFPDDEGYPEKLVAFFHLQSETLLRIQPNWYPGQETPFDLCPYIVREHSIPGIGVGHMGIPFQIEVSTMHNQRLDNATIMNTPAYKYKIGSIVGPEMRLTPGEGVGVDEMDDFDPFQWGQKYDSTAEEENLTMGYLRERIGVQQLDMTDQINATNFMSVMQEAAGKSDQIVDNIRTWLASVVRKSLLLTAKYYPEGRTYMVLGEAGQMVEAIFRIGEEAIQKGLTVSVTATQSVNSQEVERQGKLSVFNLLTQYYGQLTQYFLQSQNPEVPPPIRMVMLEIVEGLGTFVLEILDDFNIRNRDELAINIDAIMQMATQQRSAGAAPGANGNAGVAAVPGGNPTGGGQAGQANQAQY